MKFTSTVKLLSIIMMCLLALTSCLDGGDDKKDDPTPTPDPDPVPEVSCALTKLTYSFDEGEQTFAYNERGDISTITSIEADGSTRISSYVYDGNNRMVKGESRLDGILQGYTTYTYENALVSKTETFDANGQLKSYITYNYDAKGNAIEYNRYTGSTIDKSVVAYTPEGNIANAEHYRNGVLQTTLIYGNYDDKKYYQTALKGLPLMGVSANKNNYGKLTAQYYNTNGDLVETREFLYKHTYNEQGYPIQEVETYNGEEYIYYHTYDCK